MLVHRLRRWPNIGPTGRCLVFAGLCYCAMWRGPCFNTFPLPISHLCENYIPLPNSHIICEIHTCTCINCDGDISLHARLKNRQPEWSLTWTQRSLAFLICAHAHSYNLCCAQGLPQGFSLKKSRFLGVVL